MSDITRKQITDYMGTLDTGTANGKVVMNQLKKAISMNESADIPFSDSLNTNVIKSIMQLGSSLGTKGGKTISRKDKKAIKQGLRISKQMGGKVYSNMQSRKVRI